MFTRGYSPNFDQIWSQLPVYPPAVATCPAILLWPVPSSRKLEQDQWGKTYRKTSSSIYSISSWRYDITYLFVGTSILIGIGVLHPFSDKAILKNVRFVWRFLWNHVFCTGYRCFLPSIFSSFPVVFPCCPPDSPEAVC